MLPQMCKWCVIAGCLCDHPQPLRLTLKQQLMLGILQSLVDLRSITVLEHQKSKCNTDAVQNPKRAVRFHRYTHE